MCKKITKFVQMIYLNTALKRIKLLEIVQKLTKCRCFKQAYNKKVKKLNIFEKFHRIYTQKNLALNTNNNTSTEGMKRTHCEYLINMTVLLSFDAFKTGPV